MAIDRLESCPLNRTCQKSQDRFDRKQKGIMSCTTYFECKVNSASWRLPLERKYDKYGQFLEVNVTPVVCEWRSSGRWYTQEANRPHCPIKFFSESHTSIGFWLDRYLPCPTASDLETRERLSADEIVAMEIKQAYQRAGFLSAVSLQPKEN